MTPRKFRSAPLEISEGQMFGRLVPFDVSALVVDVVPKSREFPRGLDVYHEGFRSGVFDWQLDRGVEMIRRIGFWHTHDHNEGAGYFGPAMAVEQRADGVYGEFRILSKQRDALLELMDAGHRDLSIEFRETPDGTSIDDDGVRWRTSARLHGVVLDPAGAYEGAEVLAARSLDELLAEHREEERLRAEREEQERAEAEAAAAKAAEEAAALEAAGERARKAADVEAWLKEQRKRQDELVRQFG